MRESEKLQSEFYKSSLFYTKTSKLWKRWGPFKIKQGERVVKSTVAAVIVSLWLKI